MQQATVILPSQGSQGDLIGDLLNMDLGPPMMGASTTVPAQSQDTAAIDLLGGGLDSLVGVSFFPPSILPNS